MGAPSAALDPGGGFAVAYRVRVTDQRGAATVVARSADGERLSTVAILDKSRFGAMSMERPALVRTPEGGWRLYVCSATPGSKHWWIDALEAAEPERLADAEATTVFPGDDRATYDGRATKEENFSERTGLARLAGPDGRLVPEGDGPAADVRYLDVLPLPGGGYRLWYEAPLPDGSHELRTELIG